jgi:hypothetical protein
MVLAKKEWEIIKIKSKHHFVYFSQIAYSISEKNQDFTVLNKMDMIYKRLKIKFEDPKPHVHSKGLINLSPSSINNKDHNINDAT